jgi:hypothetical protein
VNSAIAPSICSNGFAVLNKTDDGYFARGVYVTFDSAYAAIYGGGLIPLELQSPANEMTIIAAWAVVVNPYPITRGIDYVKTNQCCDLLGSTVKGGYDSHFVLVDRQGGPGSVAYQACVDAGGAVPLSYTYSELVLKDEAQVMARFVLRCRKKASAASPPSAPVLPVPPALQSVEQQLLAMGFSAEEAGLGAQHGLSVEQQLLAMGFSAEEAGLGAQHGETVQQASIWLLMTKESERLLMNVGSNARQKVGDAIEQLTAGAASLE